MKRNHHGTLLFLFFLVFLSGLGLAEGKSLLLGCILAALGLAGICFGLYRLGLLSGQVYLPAWLQPELREPELIVLRGRVYRRAELTQSFIDAALMEEFSEIA